jgi:uncharacterized LabA/DUF88 family protein
MPPEPLAKRTVVFVDGQNLVHAAREAFGYMYPNYDVRALAERICAGRGWQLTEARFYTGIPDPQDDPRWHHFWSAKLAVIGRQEVRVYSRSLRYRNQTVRLPDGKTHTFLAGEEKGIDVRIALDVIRMAHRTEYDVAVILSQDQDLLEVAEEIRVIAREQNRWIKIACAFPSSPTSRSRCGIDKTDWIRIDRATYDACLDRRDYRRGLPADVPSDG